VKPDRRFFVAVGAAGLLMAGWLAATALIVWSALDPAERDAVGAALGPRLPLAAMTWLFAVGIAAAVLHGGWRRYVAAPAALLDQLRVLLATDTRREVVPVGSPELRALAGAIDELQRQKAQLVAEGEARVAQASRRIAQERNRLAALMSELTQSVVVCNLDGRILLYNTRARQQFRALSQAPTLADGAELIGLGRSIYAALDRRLVAHALEDVRQRLARGAANPSAQFVTATSAGRLMRVQMAPVREADDAPAGEAGEGPAGEAGAAIAGFVLMLDDITVDHEQAAARDRLLHELTDRNRAALANVQAALDMLEFPDIDPAMRERFRSVVRDEVRAMSQRIQQLSAGTSDDLKTRWPLEDVLGADLAAAALGRIEALRRVAVGADEVDPDLWMKVDGFSLLQALSYLADRLVEEFGLRSLRLRLASAGRRAQLDLVWAGQAMSTETVMSWELDPMRFGDEVSSLTVRDVVERHGAEFWFERDRARGEALFRFLLPLAAPQQPAGRSAAAGDASRPEYYDFDLFQVTEQTRALDERRLAELVYTVFDTETTGLEPSGGDEIIQIGATRIVNGRLLRHESFEQLVDPKRPIPAASIPIHGIQPEMVAGKPTIAEVLPAFHAFTRDTVLVAHNAAFDMRFLKLKEAETGVAFEHPVLDTLLLSAVVHPNQASHRLEAIAERFGIDVIGRHTALGDALVTAEVFLKLLPLLAERGIHTLGQAREAAQRTYYARLKY
jgi:DNA polymerase-3 subunit epsilon